MRILIDECVPRALKSILSKQGHDCATVQEVGWAGKQNGELLKLAETAYDVLITIDVNLRYQQNLVGRKLSVILLLARTNRLENLRPLFPACAAAVLKIKAGELLTLEESS